MKIWRRATTYAKALGCEVMDILFVNLLWTSAQAKKIVRLHGSDPSERIKLHFVSRTELASV